MSYIVFVRHGESHGNESGILTGQLDVPLTDLGIEQGKEVGAHLFDLGLVFHKAYSSRLQRAQHTLNVVLEQMPQSHPHIQTHGALNERDFGDYTGKSKLELQQAIGEKAYKEIVKGWNVMAPNGESLQDVQLRAVPYFESEILPNLKNDQNVIVIAHHQTLRAIIKHLDNISDEAISGVSIGNAQPIIYRYDMANGVLKAYTDALRKSST